MKLAGLSIHVVYVNLDAREDRRAETEFQLSCHGLTAERRPGVPESLVRDAWGFQNQRRYACSLAKRLAIRQGRKSEADAVLLLEDDIVLHPQFRQRLAELELPEDWQMLYLGCRHIQRPWPVGPGLVRCTQAADNHAVIFRRGTIRQALQRLRGTGRGKPGTIRFSDEKLSELHQEIPCYAAYPNLVWQRENWSDGGACHVRNYSAAGRQLALADRLAEIDSLIEAAKHPGRGPVEGAGGNPQQSPTDHDAEWNEVPGFDYLREAPSRYHFEDRFPMRAYINLSKREDRRQRITACFAGQDLAVERFHAVDGRGVENPRGHGPPPVYACRLSHRLLLRQAIHRKEPAVLIFEDDVVLHFDFRRLAEALPPPEDWGIIFFGCTHVETPEVVAPGWVRVKRIWSLQAYAVKAGYLKTVLNALNAKGVPGREEGADVAISRLADQIPMYAVYPNIAWQEDGFSDLMEKDRHPFDRDGQQNRLRHVLRQTNWKMRNVIARAYGTPGGAQGFLRPEEVHAGGGGERKWRMEDVFPERRYLNLNHRPDRKFSFESQLSGQGLEVKRFAAMLPGCTPDPGALHGGEWGCALSHAATLEDAHATGAEAVLIFEDDAMLHPQFREWCEAIALPEDWAVLYFGAQHTEDPVKVIAPGLVRCTGAYSAHAYAVRGPWLAGAAAAIRQGIAAGIP